MAPVELANDVARVAVRPDLGAGLTRYDIWRDGVWEPIFRAVPDETDHPFQLSNILLVPFSGRVSGGGFTFAGRFHALAPNLAGEKLPIHGSGFNAAWHVLRHSPDEIVLALMGSTIGPFRFDAQACYRLEGAALRMELAVTNRAGGELPYGLGFHPWFVRDVDTRLCATAATAWLEGADHLAAGALPMAARPDMDFSTARRLPEGWLLNWTEGWDGRARISWPRRKLAVAIEASEDLGTYVLYSPKGDADFVCFEPVSHPVDAFQPAGRPWGRMASSCSPTARPGGSGRFIDL
jgi:aldose 1-epimerase